MATRNAFLSAAGLAGIIALSAACGTGDASSNVDPITADGVGAATPTSEPAPDAPSNSTGTAVAVETVTGLDQLSGALRSGDDPDDWEVAGVEVNFGPDGWIQTAPAFEDYDADGTAEPLLEELRGLDGSEVDLGIRYEVDDDNDRDDAEVFTISGLAFRDPTGPAPWQTTTDGAEITRDEAVAAAVAAVGNGAVLDDIDRETEVGWNGWDVEVRDANGNEYNVLVDADGTVIDVRPDDDNTAASPSATTQTPTATDTEAVLVDANADIDVDDQTGDGTSVTIREVRLSSTPGFIVIRTDDPDAQILGHVAIDATTADNAASVALDTPLSGTTRLEAVLYADNGDNTFDPANDLVIVDEQNDQVDDQVDDDFTYTTS